MYVGMVACSRVLAAQAAGTARVHATLPTDICRIVNASSVSVRNRGSNVSIW